MSTSPKFDLLAADGPLRRPIAAVSPTPADLGLMRTVAILQYLAGGATLLGAVVVLHRTDAFGRLGFLVLGLVAVTFGILRSFQRGGQPLWQARCSNLGGVAFVAAIVAVARPVGMTPAFFLWPVLTAAYFLRRRDLALVLLAFVLSYAAALWGFSDADSPIVVFVPLALVVLVVTVLVRLMRESLAGMIVDLRATAATDELTGLPNRADFLASSRLALDRGRRVEAAYSVVLIDLDHFKRINDRLGHAAGDAALRRFSALLTAECRGGDLPARYGGEEFVVGLQSAGIAAAERFAERLRARVEAATAGDASPLTLSAGVATAHAGDDGPEALIARADAALYAAKAEGRNRVVRASEPAEA